MENLRPLKWVAKKRELITSAAIEKLCETAVGKNDDGSPVTKNAQQFCDYVRLMAFCGSRRDETLRLKWDDVNWERKQLTIGADGLSKNYTSRVVDFNPDLESHLRSMEKRRQPDSKWLFPSPQRGEKDQHAKTFKESLNLSRAKAGVPNFNFHDCRHYFISHAVMAGVDFMTIAAWVGHQDGGVLIGKVYGHLADEHKKRMANQLVFTPRIVEAPATTVPRSNARESIEEQEGRGSSDVPAANEN